jgi:hypothetical protein
MGIFTPNIEKLKEKRDIKGLINALHDKHPRNELAAKALIELKDRNSLPELIKIVEQAPETESSKSDAARKAVEVIGEIGDTSAIPVLVKAMSKELGMYIGLHPAADALVKIGDAKAVPLLLNALDSSTSSLRRNAIKALGRLRSKEAMPTLANLLHEPEVRKAVICALGEIGDASIIPQMVKAIEDADHSTRQIFFASLITLQDKAALSSPEVIEKWSLASGTLLTDLKAGLKDAKQTYALHYLCTIEEVPYSDPIVASLLLDSLPALSSRDLKWKIAHTVSGEIPRNYRWPQPFEDCVRAIVKLGVEECITKLEETSKILNEQDREIVEKAIDELG